MCPAWPIPHPSRGALASKAHRLVLPVPELCVRSMGSCVPGWLLALNNILPVIFTCVVCLAVIYSFLSPSNIPRCECTTIYPFSGRWTFGSFPHMSCDEWSCREHASGRHVLSFRLDQRVGRCLAFEDTAACMSQGLVSIGMLSKHTGDFLLSHPPSNNCPSLTSAFLVGVWCCPAPLISS